MLAYAAHEYIKWRNLKLKDFWSKIGKIIGFMNYRMQTIVIEMATKNNLIINFEVNLLA